MARAITQIRKIETNPEELQAQASAEIMQVLTENKDAIIAAIGVLKGLNEMKILESVQALMAKGEDVGVIAIQQLNQPGMHNIIKNAMGAFKFLGTLQPDQMNTLLEGVGHGLKKMSHTGEKGEKQSVWRLRARFWTPEIRAAMTTMVDFLQGMGEVFLRNRRENEQK